MANYFIMTEAMKDTLITEVRNRIRGQKTWIQWVKENREDFEPIEIKTTFQGNKLFVLPVSVRDNPLFVKLKEYGQEIGIEVRSDEVLDFYEWDLDGNRS